MQRRVGAREYGITGSKSEAEDRVSEELSKGCLLEHLMWNVKDQVTGFA